MKLHIDQHLQNRSEKLARQGVQKIADWLIERGSKSSSKELKILDYGCGYFDLGLLVDTKADIHVHGYEPEKFSFEFAQSRAPSKHVYSDLTQVPKHSFDLIVLNSVLQYFQGAEEFEDLLKRAKEFFHSEEDFKEIVLTDVIPRSYNKFADVIFSLWLAWTNGMFFSMIRHIFKVALSAAPSNYFQIDYEEIEALAKKHGFIAYKLKYNLAPSRYRYTVVLKCV